MAPPGNVGFVSQSGALLTAVLDWSPRESVGFSAVVSLGSMLDVGWGDLIDYLGDDPHTQSILIYMEIDRRRARLPVGRARGGADQADHRHQAGRTAQAAQGGGLAHGFADRLRRGPRRRLPARAACCASTASPTCSAWPRCWRKQPRPRGPNLTIVTNAGGPGVLATDALIAGGGGLTALSDDTMAAFNAVLPAVLEP